MLIYSLILYFIVGLMVGSFLNVVIYRLYREGGIINGRSKCPHCQKQLSWIDLVPVLSFVILGGKCRYCGHKISLLYVVIEIITGLSFLFLILINPSLGFSQILISLGLISVFIVIVFFDYSRYIIPDILILPAILVVFLYKIIFTDITIANILLPALSISGFFAIIYLVSRGAWIGFGDIKLAFLIGLVFSYYLGFFVVLFAVWTGALWGITLILIKRGTLKTALPFGSFLSAISIIFIIFQNALQHFLNFF